MGAVHLSVAAVLFVVTFWQTAADGCPTDWTTVMCHGSVSCSQPPKVAYAYVSAPEKLYEHGGKVHYICLKGYQQTNGSIHKVCENGTWTGEDIGCEKITLPPNPDIDPDALKDYIRMCCLKGLKTKAGSGTCKELSLPMCEPCKTPFLKCCVDKTINIYRSTLYTAITSYSKLLVN